MIIAVAMAELASVATPVFAPVAASVIAVVIAEGALKVITMLLEATLLTHLTTLGVGLHGSAGGTVFAEATVKHDIFAKLAFQRTIEEGRLQRRLQPDALEALFTVAQDPCFTPGELTLELLSDGLVQAQQVGL